MSEEDTDGGPDAATALARGVGVEPMDPVRVTRPPRANGLLLYRGLITIAGLGVLALEVHRLPTAQPFGTEPWLFAAFAALLVLAETQSLPWIARVGGGEVTASGAFAFALLLIAPPAPGLVMLAFATAVSDMLQRKDLARTVFNPANTPQLPSAGIVNLYSDKRDHFGSAPSRDWW